MGTDINLSPHDGTGRLKLLLFLFLLATLLLGGRREFFHSDGVMEYRAGEAIYHRGAIDLPPSLASGNKRYVLGRDGRAYSIFGIGSSLQFAATVAADRALGRLTGDPVSSTEGERAPGFFSTNANVPVVALTGVVLFSLLLDLGVAVAAALPAALLGVLGTMVAVYATLSFDMSLANLFLLSGVLFFLRACRGARTSDGLLAGVLVGAGILTRITTVIFLPALGLHALLEARRRGRGGFRALSGPAAAFLVAVAGAALVVGWYNWRRFGSPFDSGYTEALVAARFDAPLHVSLPTLLLSPGRGIFTFSPLLLLALPGIPGLLRGRRAEGATLLLLALTNLLFFAANRNWSNAFMAWGPRFQLTTTLLLAVPFAFWLERAWGREGPGGWRRVLAGVLPALAVALQAVVLVAGTPDPVRRFWSLGASQVVRAVGRLAAIARAGRWSELDLWWLGPWGDVAPLRAAFAVAVAVAAVSGALIVRELRRRGGRAPLA